MLRYDTNISANINSNKIWISNLVNHINVQFDVISGQVGNLELLVTYQQIWIAFKVPITLLTEFPLFLSLSPFLFHFIATILTI